MFKVYHEVSPEESIDCDVSEKEFCIAIKAIGVAILVGIDNCEAIRLVAEITPNAHLRAGLIHAKRYVSDKVSFSEPFGLCFPGDGLNYFYKNPFTGACNYGEHFNKLGEMLLMYAKDSGVPEHALAEQIGRDSEINIFIADMSNAFGRRSFFTGLLGFAIQTREELKRVFSDIAEDMSNGKKIADAFAKHSDWFDPFFLAVIKFAEENDKLPLAFQLLAEA